MKWQFFTVDARAPEAGQEALNSFCARHRVVAVEKQFVPQGAESFWSICVTYQEGGESGAMPANPKRDRLDYREVLSEPDFAVYAQLRTLRKAMAEREGVPAYALFTNEQLAEMVTRRAISLADLGAIEGVGKSRLDKYGEPFLGVLKAALQNHPGKPDAAPPNRTG